MKKNFFVKFKRAAAACCMMMTVCTALSSNLAMATEAAESKKSYTTPLYGTSSYLTVTKSNAPIRTGASNQKDVYMKLAKNSLVRSTGTVKNSAGNVWYKTSVNGKTYYIYSGNVKKASSTTKSTLVKTTKNNAPLRKSPYAVGTTVQKFTKGTILYTVGSVTNTVGNKWWVVKLENDNNLYYMYSGNVASSYTKSGNTFLDADAYFQNANDSCSGAAALTVLRHRNTAMNVSDTALLKKTRTYVYKTRDVINSYLGSGTYQYGIFDDEQKSQYENAIRTSLAQGSPVIARIRISNKRYYNYTSSGHYSTITGIYTDSKGKVWLQMADSYCNRYSSNEYTNNKTGVVHIPLDTLFAYGNYGGKSDRYLIYNP